MHSLIQLFLFCQLCVASAFAEPQARFFTAWFTPHSTTSEEFDIRDTSFLGDLNSPIVPVQYNPAAAKGSWGGVLVPVPRASDPGFDSETVGLLAYIRPVILLDITSSGCNVRTRLTNLREMNPAGVIMWLNSTSGANTAMDGVDWKDLPLEAPVIQIAESTGGRITRAINDLDNRATNVHAASVEDHQGMSRWIGYTVVTQPQSGSGTKEEGLPVTPVNPTRVQAEVLWQFGLAMIGGILMFGIPCTCLLSYWARRRLLRNNPVTNDVEAQVAVSDRQLIKVDELGLFPIKPYRKDKLRRQVVGVDGGVDSTKQSDDKEDPLPVNHLSKIGDEMMPSMATLVDQPLAQAERMPISDTCNEESTDQDASKLPYAIQRTSTSASTHTNHTSVSLAYQIDTCPICLEAFIEGEPIRELLPCRHYFHNHCIEPWLTTRCGVCPVCRFDLVKELHPEYDEETNTEHDGLEEGEVVEVQVIATEAPEMVEGAISVVDVEDVTEEDTRMEARNEIADADVNTDAVQDNHVNLKLSSQGEKDGGNP
ncbi:hypothetical protein BC832DRAFT_592563 [Gaertneriomyces semiglobifer]|nr:hypothetical protein BC832DRAFT_592563 [Gaertneriomyces semiglobifer]